MVRFIKRGKNLIDWKNKNLVFPKLMGTNIPN